MAIVIAGMCAFIIITLRKWGVLEYLQARTWRWLPWGCNFCLGFWLSVLFSTLAFTFLEPFTWSMLLVPILATTFNNALLK
jgi:hypothetical protein